MKSAARIDDSIYERDNFDGTELANCNFVKTVLMLIIVLYHSILFWRGDWFSAATPVLQSGFLRILIGWMKSIHNYAFVFVSGYIYYYSRYEAGKYRDYYQFVKNKVKRLLIPYFFVSLIWAAPISSFFFNYDSRTVFSKYFLGTNPGYLWFLLMLFHVFVIFSIISDYCRKHLFLGGILAFLLWGISQVGAKLFVDYFYFWSAFAYIPYFWLGFINRKEKHKVTSYIPSIAWIVIYSALFVIMEPLDGMELSSILSKIIRIALKLLIRLVGAVMAFSVLQDVAKRVDWKSNRVFLLLSRYSMVIYLFHEPIIYFCIIWFNGIFSPYVHAMINFTVAMSISLIISAIAFKFKWTRALVGEK